MSALDPSEPAKNAILAKAVLHASEQLGLKQADLAAALGLHKTAVRRLKQNPDINPDSKEGELALLLVRLARALSALTGGDNDWIQHFMRSPNNIIGGVPAQQIARIEGLMRVLQFVVTIRDKAQISLPAPMTNV